MAHLNLLAAIIEPSAAAPTAAHETSQTNEAVHEAEQRFRSLGCHDDVFDTDGMYRSLSACCA